MLGDHLFHEILMDQFSTCAPLVGILHEQKMIASGNNVANMRWGTSTVEVGFLVDELFDEPRR